MLPITDVQYLEQLDTSMLRTTTQPLPVKTKNGFHECEYD